jgi:hypothetical protein
VYKDTAKWLLTFLPISTFVALAVGLAPRYEAIEGAGFRDWVCGNRLAFTATLVTLAATVVIIIMCCAVLLTGPTDLAALRADETWWSTAFSQHGVGEPMFTDSSAFDRVANPPAGMTVSEAQAKAYNDTIPRITKLSEDLKTRARFKCFAYVFVVCTVLIGVGLSVATATLPATPEAVTKATKVSIFIPPGTEARFVKATGCVSLHDTTAVAVGGTWAHPKLRLIGTGCPTRLWTPGTELDAVVAPG